MLLQPSLFCYGVLNYTWDDTEKIHGLTCIPSKIYLLSKMDNLLTEPGALLEEWIMYERQNWMITESEVDTIIKV